MPDQLARHVGMLHTLFSFKNQILHLSSWGELHEPIVDMGHFQFQLQGGYRDIVISGIAICTDKTDVMQSCGSGTKYDSVINTGAFI